MLSINEKPIWYSCMLISLFLYNPQINSTCTHQKINPPEGFYSPVVACDASINNSCQAVVLWLSNRYGIATSFFEDNTFTDSTFLVSGRVNNFASVSLNNSGKAIAVWSEQDNTIKYAIFDPVTKKWSDPDTVPGTQVKDSREFLFVSLDDADKVVLVFFDGEVKAIDSGNCGTDWNAVETLSSTDIDDTSIKFARSHNRENVAVSWANQAQTKSQTAIFDGTTWDIPGANYVLELLDVDEEIERLELDINNSGNVAEVWVIGKFINDNRQARVDGDFFNSSPGGTITPLQEYLPVDASTDIYSISISLNDNDRALAFWTFGSFRFASEIGLSSQYRNGMWEKILSIPKAKIQFFEEIFVCNDENGDGVALFPLPTPDGESGNDTGVSRFDGASSTWGPVKRIFEGLPFGLGLVCAADCVPYSDPTKSNIVFMIDSFWTFVCCQVTSINSLEAPKNLTGIGVQNNFATQAETLKSMTWTPSTESEVVTQKIYRNDKLTAKVDKSTSSFTEHNRPFNTPETYRIEGVTQDGTPTAPAAVVIT